MTYNTTWIFAAGMRRSASTLQYLLAKELVEREGGLAVGWVTHQEFTSCYRTHDGKHPFVILKTHAFTPIHDAVANIIFQKSRALALTTCRDPRDVAVSLMGRNRYTETWKGVLENIPTILREFTAWSSLSAEQVLVQEYANCLGKTGLKNMLAEIARFLDFTYPQAWGHKCVARHTLKAHKKLIEEYDGKYDRVNLFWHNHLDNGEVGRYKKELTVEQQNDIRGLVDAWKEKL